MAKQKRNKISELYEDKQKETDESEAYIRTNFYISKDQRDKLKRYAEEISLPHIRVKQSEVIRYMIENFDVKKAKENFFKQK